MKIAYVAKHFSGGNDDEGSISHALEMLGHSVERIHEKHTPTYRQLKDCDLLLCHHGTLRYREMYLDAAKVFWWFDLVDWPDPSTRRRSYQRTQWMEQNIPWFDLGFMSDGDYAETNEKLVHLFQGADTRIMRPPKLKSEYTGNILFAGGKPSDRGRASWFDEMRGRYGRNFLHVRRSHRKQLITIIDDPIVVVPDSPITDLYWSNRIFISMGFGAFVIHPYCQLLAEYYEEDKEIVFYHSRKEMYEKIDYYRTHHEARNPIRQAGYDRTIAEHTYTHRCKTLIETVKERLL